MDETDPRQVWRQHQRAWQQWHQRWEHFLASQEPLPLGVLLGSRRALTRILMVRHATEQAVQAERPAFPEIYRGMTCGAKTRTGTPCKRGDLYGPSARCRLHGGLSTGPKTAEGKQRAALNGRQPKRKRTP
jgi:hypothetical protein